MARNTTSKALIAYEAYERFAAIIRHQKMSERVAAQWELAFDLEYDLRKSDWTGHPPLHDPTVAEVAKSDLTTSKFDTLRGSQAASTMYDGLLNAAVNSSKQRDDEACQKKGNSAF